MRSGRLASAPPIRLFQSAPGREAGRCTTRLISTAAEPVFQSAPGREAGRCSRAPRAVSSTS